VTKRVVRARLGYAIAIFFAGLVLAAGLFAVLNGPMEQIMTYNTAQADTEAAQTGLGWLNDAWAMAPWAVLGLSMVQLVVADSLEARRP